MPILRGTITRVQSYEEEGRTDWALALSKLLWYGTCLLFPLCLFRFVNDLFNPYLATVSVLLTLFMVRLLIPLHLVALDEIVVRIFPSLRGAIRFGRVRIYDFRIKGEDGSEVSCILRGDLRGGAPLRGDLVQLEGVYRWGTFRIRRGVNHTTRSSLAPRPSHSLWILLTTVMLLTALGLFLWGSLDPWVYPIASDLIDFLLPPV